MTATAESAAARVHAAVEALRDTLRARHGWTHLQVQVTADAAQRTLVLRGEVAVTRLVQRVARLAAEVAPDWQVDVSAVAPMQGGDWHAAPTRVVPLWAGCPAVDDSRRLATELRPADGPVQRLGHVGDAAVVRGRDGTVGWWDGPLGPNVAPPMLAAPRDCPAEALVGATTPWHAVPYVLGGATEAGIDCSALVQRLVWEQLGVVLPRHSSDQLGVAPHEGMGPGAGDLCFVWSDREALCHVGIGTGDAVVHASLSRRRVVLDPVAGFVQGARKTMHVPFAQLGTFGRSVAGYPSLIAAGFVLGRELDPG